jgi:ribulose-5-phosphate 4-epimerase/fuculose-1-phosphate aldolase
MSRVPIPPEQQPLRQEVCRIGRSLFERGLVHSTAGNISLRFERGYLITPTDACLGFLEPEQLACTAASTPAPRPAACCTPTAHTWWR